MGNGGILWAVEALWYGDGTQGGLIETYSGPPPTGYDPMKLQDSIELGTGVDNSPWGKGEFFEGAVVAGYPSDATESAVQASVVGYWKTCCREVGQEERVPGCFADDVLCDQGAGPDRRRDHG
jgi:hypothetical protein